MPRHIIIDILNSTFNEMLKETHNGAMAYVKFLPNEELYELFNPPNFDIKNWDVYLVTGAIDSQNKLITADQAVNLREKKEKNILLFVDKKQAGAGMDGIYSASREINESDFFKIAHHIVLKKLPTDIRHFVEMSKKIAKKIGKKNSISPWQEFFFYCSCFNEPEKVGTFIADLGLWPIDTSKELNISDIDSSFQMVERLLLTTNSNNTIPQRIQSLLLPEEEKSIIPELEKFIRSCEGMRWREKVLKLKDYPQFYLNQIHPGFLEGKIKKIELIQWRSSNKGKPFSWSGLEMKDDHNLYYFPKSAKEKSKSLQVRWKTIPTVKQGSVTYHISILTGSGTELVGKECIHTGKNYESCSFFWEDFDEEGLMDGEGKWEAIICVHPTNEKEPEQNEESDLWKISETFILSFEEQKSSIQKTTVGKIERALVEGIINGEEEAFVKSCEIPRVEDSKGFISLKEGGKSYRIFRPDLIKEVEDSWQQNNFVLGRWKIKIREDGSKASPLEFIPFNDGICDDESWKRVDEATKFFAKKCHEQAGIMGFIYHDNDYVDKFINSWINILEKPIPILALVNTVEVQAQNGKNIGLIVLPNHPLRVAWHQAYDELVFYSRYRENLSVPQIKKTFSILDGSFFPAILPGLQENQSFVFGEMLNFYTVAMINSYEKEPQAAIALMNRCIGSYSENTKSQLLNISTAEVIANEVKKYIKLHPEYKIIKINTFRPGDGYTLVEALGKTFEENDKEELTEDSLELNQEVSNPLYIIYMYPYVDNNVQSRLVGRYITELSEKRRSGVASISKKNRWIFQNCSINGINYPRLRWSKCLTKIISELSHLGIAFDTFDSNIVSIDKSQVNSIRPLEIYGLYPSIIRKYHHEQLPYWENYIAFQTEGSKHPLARSLTERLQKLQNNILKLVAINLNSKNDQNWPVIKTIIKAEQADFIQQIHFLSDWVITIDRNIGLEYFDSPKENPNIYDTYIIDCVPERQDINTVQLITSTSQVEEIKRLLNQTLNEMNLSCSPRNCQFLLSNLKAISGRLAMRLAQNNTNGGELIALALFYSTCSKDKDTDDWFSISKGFFIPVDDIQDLIPNEKNINLKFENDSSNNESTNQEGMRADLIFVDLDKRGKLRFTFIEIKYRRLLRFSQDQNLFKYISKQLENTRKKWFNEYFSGNIAETILSIKRKKLARALQFYADKAHRHYLKEEFYNQLCQAIDKLYQPINDISQENIIDRGYIFCPEFLQKPEKIYSNGSLNIYLFGPQVLPDMSSTKIEDYDQESSFDYNEHTEGLIETNSDKIEEKNVINGDTATQIQEEIELIFGKSIYNEKTVTWKMTLKGNPHLMIVGQPGMGKTTCINSLSIQLYKQKIIPIIFSFHEDIESKLKEHFDNMYIVDFEKGLGFNPLKVVRDHPHAWVDHVGMLRDIFASIYPDFGDLQNNEIREAIKQSFTEIGYGLPGVDVSKLETPAFQRFYEILKSQKKPNPGIIARLNELNDYGFFSKTGERTSLLDSKEPTLIRIYSTTNEVLQNALASFLLLNLYQNMFIRGVQEKITHVVIFDEAHRASKLKLLPIMAKECRKFGLSLIVSSQEAKDFHSSIYSAISNYLILRVVENDANTLAKNITDSSEMRRIADKLKKLEKYHAILFCEGECPVSLMLNKA
ncbi:MAG: ATP-binding protein [Candidatus Methanofastidiosa archaeon]|nr:ATP-binding protein [Candidatus Methanofastidiosa archaeon]